MKLKRREALTGYALVLPLLCGCMLFYAIPFALVALSSVVRGGGFGQSFVGTQNYEDLLKNDVFRMALGNTVKFLILGLVLILVISYAIALLLRRPTAGSKVLRSVVMLPYVLPVVGTVLLVDLLFTESGLMNEMLKALHLPVQDWLHSGSAFWVALGIYLWKNTGYCVLILLSGLVGIPREHHDAAQLDGAGPWQRFRHITVPQMWYSVFFAGVFSLINAFKCFREIFLIGGKHPHSSIYMLQHFINNSFQKLGYAKTAAASLLLIGLLIGLLYLGYRWVMRKEAFRA